MKDEDVPQVNMPQAAVQEIRYRLNKLDLAEIISGAVLSMQERTAGQDPATTEKAVPVLSSASKPSKPGEVSKAEEAADPVIKVATADFRDYAEDTLRSLRSYFMALEVYRATGHTTVTVSALKAAALEMDWVGDSENDDPRDDDDFNEMAIQIVWACSISPTWSKWIAEYKDCPCVYISKSWGNAEDDKKLGHVSDDRLKAAQKKGVELVPGLVAATVAHPELSNDTVDDFEDYGGPAQTARKASQSTPVVTPRGSIGGDEGPDDGDEDNLDLFYLQDKREALYEAATAAADAMRVQKRLAALGAQKPFVQPSFVEDSIRRWHEAEAGYAAERAGYIAKGGDPRLTDGPTPDDVTAVCIKLEDAQREVGAANSTCDEVDHELHLHVEVIPRKPGDEEQHTARTKVLKQKLRAAEERHATAEKVLEEASTNASLDLGVEWGKHHGCARATASVVYDRMKAAEVAVEEAEKKLWESEEEMIRNPTPANKEKFDSLKRAAVKARDEFKTAEIECEFISVSEYWAMFPDYCA